MADAEGARRLFATATAAATAGPTPPPLGVTAPATLDDLLMAWCGAACGPVAAAALRRASGFWDIREAAGSTVERSWQTEAVPSFGDGDPEQEWVAAKLLQADPGNPADPSAAVRAALAGLTGGAAERFRLLARFFGPTARPIVVLAAGDPAAAMAGTVAVLVQVAERAPEVAVVVYADRTGWDRLSAGVDPHGLAILTDGLSDVPGDHEDATARGPAPAGASRTRLPDLRRRTAAAVAAARSVAAPPDADGRTKPPVHAAARSLAEALLHAALEADPRTAGLFELNADGGFTFGDRQAEVDLLCGRLGIAVEVDGYFHFQNAAAYRRDRAKDWLMQRHGLLVLRFLAADVSDDPAFAVDRIAETVAGRKRDVGRVRTP
ncbi:MAG TPA: DUF559 domain-containing protein [Humisphaera sp.]